MSPWEHRIGRTFTALRLDSIKNKIVALALVATLIPTLFTAVVSYVQNTSALTEQLDEELRGLGVQTAQELDLWVRQRFYDVGVLGSSFEVSENLERLDAGGPDGMQSAARMSDYVTAVQGRFPDYVELLVLNENGALVTSSDPTTSGFTMPPGWGPLLRAGSAQLSDPFLDPRADRIVAYLAQPIPSPTEGTHLGALVAKLSFSQVDEMLAGHAPGNEGRVHLVLRDGGVITSFPTGKAARETALRGQEWVGEALAADAGEISEYADAAGRTVLGTVQPVSNRGWNVIVELPRAEAYAPVIRLRNLTLLLVFVLLGIIGATAYFLGLAIVRPLDRLTAGAAEVANGDLSVDLPGAGKGEVGYLTEVFNDMVRGLREGREALDRASQALIERNAELERLSVTDGLTELTNRRRAMEILLDEVRRADRYGQAMSLLMIDVDHFKQYNDTHGHLEGDMVLRGVAKAIKQGTRGVDTASRYGGEEFMVLLPECDTEGALEAGRRILTRLSRERFRGGAVTMSVGAAVYPIHADAPEALIAAADAALYRAKHAGRDRVVLASIDSSPVRDVPVTGRASVKKGSTSAKPLAKKPSRKNTSSRADKKSPVGANAGKSGRPKKPAGAK